MPRKQYVQWLSGMPSWGLSVCSSALMPQYLSDLCPRGVKRVCPDAPQTSPHSKPCPWLPLIHLLSSVVRLVEGTEAEKFVCSSFWGGGGVEKTI